ncbi:hypothetical protein EPA93_09905 [Ktedonosporobacter rubrisoli]|uniref:CN hydrolase domain-containing protein n=1 Tax=Ktedonosporobacter rubrisoli TaxID=2509675 RepID=A0A4P6JME3_KTERU|nr:nitrilase-related carbon-nitrogen hydrolase [Ktedonosporobacter rubrisoli]QBD76303.1 hypothetical protein EPA93_09905 [Ktedonosporobacter rubrisoli]
MENRIASDQARATRRPEYIWLVTGLILSLFATNGRWDLSLAAWLYPIFFLRFSRTSGALIGFIGIWLATIGTMAFFLAESELFNPIMMAVFVLFSAVLALPYLLDRLISPRLGLASGILATLVFPLARVACEYVITFTPFGSMFSLAYTQHGNLPLLQVVSITGVYGVSFLLAWLAPVVNWAWEQRLVWSRIRATSMLYCALLALVLLGGSIRLAFFPPTSQTIRVAGISASKSTYQKVMQISNFTRQEELIPLNRQKMSAAFAILNDELLRLSQQEARAGAKIVIWPEGGSVVLAEDVDKLLEQAKTLARTEHVYLDMGMVVLLPKAPYAQDRAIMVEPTGQVAWTFDKAHPVPAMEDFTPGDGKLPIVDTPYGRISNVICFDADFPDLMRQRGANSLDLMLVPGNDWLGIDPWHTYNATFRAIENGYSLVRQASHGLAMAVDYQGHVLGATDYFTTDQQTMLAFVPTKGVLTLYALVGDLFAWLCIAGLLLLGGYVSLGAWQRRLPGLKVGPAASSPLETEVGVN